MTTRVHIRLPHGNHLAASVAQETGGGPIVLDHGRGQDFWISSGNGLSITEVPRPEGGAPTYAMSRAEKLAGVSFNPSGDARVSEAKDGYAARIAEILGLLSSPIDTDQANMLVAARDHLMAAQMLVVKAITWRG